MKKKLTKIRLINWHYFSNETININGSVLVTGENTSGKSTLLDAIQLVLTTSARKFNIAANEKSNRSLKGYVRCKTGNEGNAYLRKGTIIGYVALEFFEEKTKKFFTLGVKIDSPDEESRPITKWFIIESKIDELSFMVDKRPAMDSEFRKGDNKVNLIAQASEARDKFRRRLGNLESRFFDIIPKSLAFKPMDNVKDFINKFLLSEKIIKINTLKNNIETLKNFEVLMENTKKKIHSLNEILDQKDKIDKQNLEIKINELLVKKAEIEVTNNGLEKCKKDIYSFEGKFKKKKTDLTELKENLELNKNKEMELNVVRAKNDAAMLISGIEKNIKKYKNEIIFLEEKVKGLKQEIKRIYDALGLISEKKTIEISISELNEFLDIDLEINQKLRIIYKLKTLFDEAGEQFRNEKYNLFTKINTNRKKKAILEKEIEKLKNKKMTYPINTSKLKEAIEKEFDRQGIDSSVRVFAGLLKIIDPKWQNAIEGYLNTQRFYIIVDPVYYNVALNVYNRLKKQIHTVGLVNTAKLKKEYSVREDSLASLVESDNIWAKAYSNYLLNSVIMKDSIDILKSDKISITFDCMLYKNKAVRKIKEDVYMTPYIGVKAIEKQLEIKAAQVNSINNEIACSEKSSSQLLEIINTIKLCDLNDFENSIEAPVKLEERIKELIKEEDELKSIKSDPSYFNLINVDNKIKLIREKINTIDIRRELVAKEIGGLEENIKAKNNIEKSIISSIDNMKKVFNELRDKDTNIAIAQEKKYSEQIKIKSPSQIKENFSNHITKLINRKEKLKNNLNNLQIQYGKDYDSDLGYGYEALKDYVSEHQKLESSEIIKYENELEKAKENCQKEFRESFLAKLKENIENAKKEFKKLNQSLNNIEYGEDSYYFELTGNANKESIYKMIMDKNNLEGYTLLSGTFNDQYSEAMDDLFLKLTADDEKGKKVIQEYTDYRSYLDYDIIINKKDGSSQKFSKIYAEKSGGETQTPYYIAIAASFIQLYKLGNTIRIIMLDEAFDKMDDDRIDAMMKFFNIQNFQIIIATPPSKMEVIGESVETILFAHRQENNSIIQEYKYNENR